MNYSILFVDDEQPVLDAIRRKMKREKEFDCYYATSVSEARKILQKQSLDAVVSDVMMQDGNGITFLDELESEMPHITRLIVSGYSSISLILEAIERASIFRYMIKPLAIDESFLENLRDAALHSRSKTVPPRTYNIYELQAIWNSPDFVDTSILP